MAEPTYTETERRELSLEFDRITQPFRDDWLRGRSFVILSFDEYLTLRVQSRPHEVADLVAAREEPYVHIPRPR